MNQDSKRKWLRPFFLVAAGAILGFGLQSVIERASNKALNQAENAVDSTQPLSSGADIQRSCYLRADDNSPLVEFGDKKVFLEQLDPNEQSRYLRLLQNNFKKEQTYLRELALRIHLDQNGGETLPSLADLVAEKVQLQDDEVRQYYRDNKNSFPANMDFSKLESTLRNHLLTSKRQEYAGRVMASEWGDGGLNTTPGFFCPPRVSKEELTDKIKLTVFIDFFCQSCRTQWPKIDRWLRANQAKIEVVAIPLVDQKSSIGKYMAIATHCASQQGAARHLEFLRQAYKIPLQSKTQLASLKDYVRNRLWPEIQADVQRFDACTKTFDAQDFVKFAKKRTGLLQPSDLPLLLVNDRWAPQSEETSILSLLDTLMGTRDRS